MPIYEGRRKGTLRVIVWAHGRLHERTFEGKRRAAKRFERALLAELQALPPTPAQGTPTFSTFCVDRYEPHAKLHLGDRTWSKVRKYQLAAFCRFFGETRLAELSPKIEEYKRDCLERKVKASTINHDLEALRTMLRWAHKQGALAVVPEILNLPDTGKRRVRCWSHAQVRALYAAAPAWLVPVLHFLLDTGCRKGEAVAAQWSWIDWEQRMLRIPVTDTWHPKDKDAREVPLDEPLLAMLRELPRRGPELFWTRLGGAYSRFPDREFKEAVVAAGLTGGPHTTRHTYASHFLINVPDLRLLAEVMGHSQTRVTELYAHLLPEHLARARGAVNLGPPSKLWIPTLAKDASTQKH